MLRLLLIASLLACVSASAASLIGRVVDVQDGNTITVLDADHQEHNIRLGGIAAPKLNQAFGNQSKQHLSSMVYDHEVSVEWRRLGHNWRAIGVVSVDGLDANLEQVRAGMAWWYRRYADVQRPEDRQAYEAAENEARAAKRGLWADPGPVPPWEWRHAKPSARP